MKRTKFQSFMGAFLPVTYILIGLWGWGCLVSGRSPFVIGEVVCSSVWLICGTALAILEAKERRQ